MRISDWSSDVCSSDLLGGSLNGVGEDVGPAQEVVNEIKAAGGQAVANTDSVATEAGGKAIIQSALDHFGRIDIVIHNAGNVRRAPLREMSYDDFNAVLDVHLRGAFHVVRSEEHTSELESLMRLSYAVLCLK